MELSGIHSLVTVGGGGGVQVLMINNTISRNLLEFNVSHGLYLS